MEALSDEQRAAEVVELQALAKTLLEFSASGSGTDHASAIKGFAAQAAGYAGKIRNAKSTQAATILVAEVTKKKGQWTDLMEMLAVASIMEHEDTIADAAEKLQKTAVELRTLASGGKTKVFAKIGAVADIAEQGLLDFQAADSVEEKWKVYSRVEEAKAEAMVQFESLQEAIKEEDLQPRPGAARSTCEDIGEDKTAPSICAPTDVIANASCDTVSADIGMDFGAALSDEPSPEEARARFDQYILDKDAGFLATLKRAVARVKDDSRFEAIHSDAGSMYERLDIAAGAIRPLPTTDDMEIAEVMRRSQEAGRIAKKHAFNIQKYDLYVAKGDMPKIGRMHAELLEISKVLLDAIDLLKQISIDAADHPKLLKFLNKVHSSAPVAVVPLSSDDGVVV